MKTQHLLPALLVFAAAFTACGEEEIETTYVEPTPVEVETPAPVMQEPIVEQVEAPAERAAEPVRTVSPRMALMPDEMRYRNMNQGYTAEDFERVGVPIKDDMYGSDKY